MSSPSIASLDATASDALLVRDVSGLYRPASLDEVLRRARYLSRVVSGVAI